MATYILLLTLTTEGQIMALRDPDYLLRVEGEIRRPGVQTLGVYAVLGSYDFVTLVEAESNELIASFSIELGVKAGVHITTLPAVPVAKLEVGGEPEAAGPAVIEQLQPSLDDVDL